MLYPFFRTGITQAIAAVLNGCDLVLLEDDTEILVYSGLSASVNGNDSVAIATGSATATATADTTNGINRFQIRGNAIAVAQADQNASTDLLTINAHGVPANYPQPVIISGGLPETVPAIADGALLWIARSSDNEVELQIHDGTQSTVEFPGYDQLNIVTAAATETILAPVLMDFRNETINILPGGQTPGSGFQLTTENNRTLQQGEAFIVGGDMPTFNSPIVAGQIIYVNTNNSLRGNNFGIRATRNAPNLELITASTSTFELKRLSAVGDNNSDAIIKLDQSDTQVTTGTIVTLTQNTVFYTGRAGAANNVY